MIKKYLVHSISKCKEVKMVKQWKVRFLWILSFHWFMMKVFRILKNLMMNLSKLSKNMKIQTNLSYSSIMSSQLIYSHILNRMRIPLIFKMDSMYDHYQESLILIPRMLKLNSKIEIKLL